MEEEANKKIGKMLEDNEIPWPGVKEVMLMKKRGIQ
jgi:hypothetical protein